MYQIHGARIRIVAKEGNSKATASWGEGSTQEDRVRLQPVEPVKPPFDARRGTTIKPGLPWHLAFVDTNDVDSVMRTDETRAPSISSTLEPAWLAGSERHVVYREFYI